MADDQKPRDEVGPEEATRYKAIPDDGDTEGHGVRFGRAIPGTEKPGPDEGIRFGKAIPGDGDTEGQSFRAGRAIPGADKPGPDEARGRPAIPNDEDAEGHGLRFKAIPDDADKPGPDEGAKVKF